MPHEAKQRIKHAWAFEVSLVDKPANDQNFLMVKSEDGPDDIPKSLDEFISMIRKRHGAESAGNTSGAQYIKVTKNGSEVTVAPEVERAFPGIGAAIGSAYSDVVKKFADKVLENELLKRKDLKHEAR